jgi:hypothetical protein
VWVVGAAVSALAAPGASKALAQAEGDRLAVAESVIAREEAASGREFDPAFRAKAAARLAALPEDALSLAQQGESGLGLNVLGDSQADLVYTPVTPCRIVDTRVAGGPLNAGFSRSFKVTGDATFQGGANCAVPFGPATSAMVNFVAVGAAGPGNLQITPFGQPLPTASIINYSTVQNVANGLAVALCDPSANTCTFDITIQANNSTVHLVADVQGYFQRVGAGGVGTALLADSAVTGAKIASGAVTGAKLAAGAVGTAGLADGAVTSTKIAGGAVVTGHLVDGTVTGAKIAVGGVGTANLADSSVTSLKIASGAVATADLADGAVTAPKIAAGAVTATFDCTSTFVSQAVAASSFFDFPIPACPAGYTVTGAGCRTPGFSEATWAISGLYRVGGTTPGTYCSGVNVKTPAAAITVEGIAQCCRVVVSP